MKKSMIARGGSVVAVMLALACVSDWAQAQAGVNNGRLSAGMGFDEQDGKSLYQGICQGCHMPDAKGASGAASYPALAGDPRVAAKAYVAVMVLNGRGAMPSFAQGLSDEQIAEVVNYVRSNFGNRYPDTMTADEVKAIRR